MDKGYNPAPINHQTIRKNVENTLGDIGISKNFLEKSPKAHSRPK